MPEFDFPHLRLMDKAQARRSLEVDSHKRIMSGQVMPMLSFRIVNPGTIEIDCDRQGMATLMGALAGLVGQGASHIHLRGPSMGGKDLSEQSPYGDPAIQEVIISYAEGD